MSTSELKKYIELVVEKRLREADVTDGKTEWGSDKHVEDLKNRIEDLVKWRDRQRKGTEARANYARLITRLRAELKSAMRQADKKKLSVEEGEDE
jgi:hypothetical protein